jgi:YVTN family beta-propeller protein
MKRVMNKLSFAFALTVSLLWFSDLGRAEPGPKDRVYTADQNTNTVSVIDPATNRLLGQIRLGVRGGDYLSVIDPTTFKETRRIETAPGPGMVLFTRTASWPSWCRASRPRWT